MLLFAQIAKPTLLQQLILLILLPFSSSLVLNSTALIIAKSDADATQASYLLNGYGLGFVVQTIPESGATLTVLNNTDGGNFGLLVVLSEVQYTNSTTNKTSNALTDEQWETLYDYQKTFKVRMVHMNVVPGPSFGTTIASVGSDNQNATVVADVAEKWFPTAGLKSVPLNTSGLFHYPATITNQSTTTAFLNFEPDENSNSTTVGGVINKFEDGREQMAYFIGAGNFSETSTLLNHVWVQWGYRGLYQGYRRINLQTQDDLFLQTALYTSGDFRLRAEDLQEHVEWSADLNSRLALGSSYFTEFGFNANGNLIYDYSLMSNLTDMDCANPVFTGWNEATGNLEFQKPLDTGANVWPTHPSYDWTGQCIFLDPLAVFFSNTSNRDALGLVSHTFTHLELNNATYYDVMREISFNLLYAEVLNFTSGERFSGSGLIPPAITGLHNGDALRAFSDNGMWNAVGDNTRAPLRNPVNQHWPLMSTMAENGFDGYQITPRFSTRIYYNCDLVACDVQQWIDTDGGNGHIYDLLYNEQITVSNQLLSLYHDPYMFHQPNLRTVDADEVSINGQTKRLSLLQMWVETVVAEITRVVNWPLITLKHDHIAVDFNRRFVRDACSPYIRHHLSDDLSQIVSFEVLAINNTCDVTIPVTVPGSVSDTQGSYTEQIGQDPLTIWVHLVGAPMTFTLEPPLDIS